MRKLILVVLGVAVVLSGAVGLRNLAAKNSPVLVADGGGPPPPPQY